MNDQRQGRIWATLLYLASLVAIHLQFVDSDLLPSDQELWLFSGLISLLLGSRLLNPHFTPPADAATNAIFASIAFLTALALKPTVPVDIIVIWVGLGCCAVIFLCAIAALLLRDPTGLATPVWVQFADRAVRSAGSPNVVFTGVIIAAVWLFHRDSFFETFIILTSWTVIIALRPVEGAIGLFGWLREQNDAPVKGIVGTIAAYQTPGIVLIRQLDSARRNPGELLLLGDEQGPAALGVAVNYVGRDEGHLLRALSLPMPKQIGDALDDTSAKAGAATLINLSEDDRNQAGEEIARIKRLRGIVDSGSTLEMLQFEVVNDEGLAEGRLVDVKVGGPSGERTLYQVVDG